MNHYKSKFLNNILEQDHRQVKSKFPYSNSFQSSRTVATTIKGIELVATVYKETRREISLFEFSPWGEIEKSIQSSLTQTNEVSIILTGINLCNTIKFQI